MDKIICLVGPSGSGKTTIAKELEKLGYNVIHSYTTREPREPNEWGHTFIGQYNPDVIMKEGGILHSISWKEYLLPKKIYKNDVIAFFDDYSISELYFATKDQYQGKGTSIYVVDPDGAEQVKRNVKDANVVTIFLMADESIRYKRMVRDRGYEAVERINKDITIFSICKCDYAVDASRSIEEVLADVKEIIEEE